MTPERKAELRKRILENHEIGLRTSTANALELLDEIDRLKADAETMGSQAIRDHLEYKQRRNEQFAAYDKLHQEHEALKAERDELLRARLAGVTGLDNDVVLMLRGERDQAVADRDRAIDAMTARIAAMQVEIDKRERRIDEVAAEAQDARRERDALRNELAAANAWLHDARLQRDRVTCDLEAIRAMINTPLTDDFFVAVRNEAAHQISRWGVESDAGKRPEDWIALVVYLLGKATKAHYDHNAEKLKHHVVTVGAVCLNWLRNINGENTEMRPGIGDPAGGS